MTTDWKQAIGGTVSEGFTAENLDTNKEYVLEPVETSYRENVSGEFKGEPTLNDIFTTVWQVEGHKTKVWQKFNLPVGYLKGQAGPNERSNVVKFAKRFRAVPKDQPFRLVDHFADHMRIRGYLKKQEKSDYYNLDLDTVGPYTPPRIEPSPQETDAALVKALLSKYNNADEALKTYKDVVPGGDEARFWLIWNIIQKERCAPVIDAEAAQRTPVK